MKPGVRVPFNNQTVDADEMDFQLHGDGHLIVTVEDGTSIELTHGVTSVYRLKLLDDQGKPHNVVTGLASMNKTVPPRSADSSKEQGEL